MTDAAGVHDGRADVVDQLFLNELLAVVDGIEHLADGERRRRVLSDDPESFLQLCRDRVFQPEEVMRLQIFAETRGFDRREPMMHVVQEMNVRSERAPEGRKE